MNRFFEHMLLQIVATVAASPLFSSKHFQAWAAALSNSNRPSAKQAENRLYSIYSRLSDTCNLNDTNFLYSSVKVELILDLVEMASFIEMHREDDTWAFEIMAKAVTARKKAQCLGIDVELKQSKDPSTKNSKLDWSYALAA